MLPSVWKYVSYEYIIELADNFQAKPLTDNPNETQQALFRRKSVSQEDISTSRVFMDWRKAFVVFALMAGKLPSAEELQAYYDRLRAEHNAADSGLVTKEAFINVSIIVNCTLLQTSKAHKSLFVTLDRCLVR